MARSFSHDLSVSGSPSDVQARLRGLLIERLRRSAAMRLASEQPSALSFRPRWSWPVALALYRMISALTGIGVTILSTVEMEESFTELPFSTYSISFLTDDIIRFRYVEIDGQLRKVMVVIKMRGGNHSKDIREYEITSDGIVLIGPRIRGYQGLTTGVPTVLDRGGEPLRKAKSGK